QHLRLFLGNLGKLAFYSFGDTGVERTSWLTQKGAIGSVLHQGMLEPVGRVRRHALLEKQTGAIETVERHSQLRFWPAHHGIKQSVGEISANCRTNLSNFLGRAEPIETCHE